MPDLLPRGARVLFCGTAAGAVSARVGAPYAGPGNAFWPTLHAVGLLPSPVAPQDFAAAAGHGIALTDLAKHVSGSDAEIGTDGFDPAAVAAKVAACGAPVVAFTSKAAGSAALGRRVDVGPQPERVGGAEAWVLPSPSGRARRTWELAPWRALAARLRDVAPVVLCAPDKLRGALDAGEAATALADGVRAAGGWPVELPVADGGEGTLDAFVAGGHADAVAVRVRDALGRPVDARIAALRADGRTVLVEAAEAIALGAVAEDERDVGRASSAGVGDLVRAALDRGAGRILVAVGGTASLDGGAGFLRALGADAPADGAGLLALEGCAGPAGSVVGSGSVGETAGHEPASAHAAPRPANKDEVPDAPEPEGADPPPDVHGAGATLLRGLDPRLAGVAIELLHDVDAPLCGPDGAARRFGPQKGASPDEAAAFDRALDRWATRLGCDPSLPGSGAAGGLGLALRAVGAVARPGAEAVLDLVGFDALATWADLVLTAEGSVDASTLQGKTVDAVVRRATALGTAVAVLGGRTEDAAVAGLLGRGAREVVALGPADRPLAAALSAAPTELRTGAAAIVARASAASG